jgi:hypothetical protein
MQLAARYDFGQEHDGGRVSHPAAAAMYLSGYLSRPGERLELPGARDLGEVAAMLRRRQVYISAHLTKPSGATMRVARHLRSLWALREGYRVEMPTFCDDVEEAWAYYWLRVNLQGRDEARRSVVVPDYGEYEPWKVRSWPGQSFIGLCIQ